MRPLVISHAACAGHAPGNTLADIRAALEMSADAIEVDIQARRGSLTVHAWTADTQSDTQRLLDLSVDSIATNYSERVPALLRRSADHP